MFRLPPLINFLRPTSLRPRRVCRRGSVRLLSLHLLHRRLVRLLLVLLRHLRPQSRQLRLHLPTLWRESHALLVRRNRLPRATEHGECSAVASARLAPPRAQLHGLDRIVERRLVSPQAEEGG